MDEHERPDEAEGQAPELTWRFGCRRSGRCCSAPGGFAWVAPDEVAPIAAALGLALPEFEARHLRQVADPSQPDAAPRLALRDRPDGACGLLEGANRCRVYAARPATCRAFPFWPSVQADPVGFERARRICPGIEAVPGPGLRERAFKALDGLLAEHYPGTDKHPDRVVGCPFEPRETPHSSALEVDRLASKLHENGQEMTRNGQFEADSALCPAFEGGACRAPSAAPAACRAAHSVAGASAAGLEAARAAVAALEVELGYPRAFGPLAQLHARRSDPALVELELRFDARK